MLDSVLSQCGSKGNTLKGFVRALLLDSALHVSKWQPYLCYESSGDLGRNLKKLLHSIVWKLNSFKILTQFCEAEGQETSDQMTDANRGWVYEI